MTPLSLSDTDPAELAVDAIVVGLHTTDGEAGPLLAPGLGAQGATAADLRTVFGSSLSSVLPSYSREVLNAGPDEAALRAAVDRVLADCRDVLAD